MDETWRADAELHDDDDDKVKMETEKKTMDRKGKQLEEKLLIDRTGAQSRILFLYKSLRFGRSWARV